MTKRASGRSAFFIAAALLIGVAGPLRAAPDDGAEQTSEASQAEPAGKPMALTTATRHHRGRHVSRRSKVRVVAKGYRRKAVEANAIPMTDSDQAEIPETIANANAKFADQASPETPSAMTSDNAVPSDQINDIDRSLAAAPASDGNAVASQIATQVASQVASNDTHTAPTMNPMAPTEQPQVAEPDSSSWGQASLVGKLFIAAGGLLMLASCARLMVA